MVSPVSTFDHMEVVLMVCTCLEGNGEDRSPTFDLCKLVSGAYCLRFRVSFHLVKYAGSVQSV
jgi:hypothetical protein